MHFLTEPFTGLCINKSRILVDLGAKPGASPRKIGHTYKSVPHTYFNKCLNQDQSLKSYLDDFGITGPNESISRIQIN